LSEWRFLDLLSDAIDDFSGSIGVANDIGERFPDLAWVRPLHLQKILGRPCVIAAAKATVVLNSDGGFGPWGHRFGPCNPTTFVVRAAATPSLAQSYSAGWGTGNVIDQPLLEKTMACMDMPCQSPGPWCSGVCLREPSHGNELDRKVAHEARFGCRALEGRRQSSFRRAAAARA
jgi:hypothetical protein